MPSQVRPVGGQGAGRCKACKDVSARASGALTTYVSGDCASPASVEALTGPTTPLEDRGDRTPRTGEGPRPSVRVVSQRRPLGAELVEPAVQLLLAQRRNELAPLEPDVLLQGGAHHPRPQGHSGPA